MKNNKNDLKKWVIYSTIGLVGVCLIFWVVIPAVEIIGINVLNLLLDYILYYTWEKIAIEAERSLEFPPLF